MAWNTGLACGFTATRSCGLSTEKSSADMMVASEADEAWWPPTFRPSALDLTWLAWWMVHDDSHRTFRASAESIWRRVGSIAIMASPEVTTSDVSAQARSKNLNFSRQRWALWDKIPNRPLLVRVYSNAHAGRHRPQDSQRSANRQPHHHAAARRTGRAFGFTVPSAGETS